MDAALDFRVLLANAKLRQGSDCCCADNGVFKDDSIVDVADILGWVAGLGALHAQQVKDADRELREFTVLNKLAEMSKSFHFVSR